MPETKSDESLKSTEGKKCLEHLEGKSSQIILEKKCFLPNSPNPPTFLIGFTGTGMIGTITVNEIIEQLKIDSLGYILSEDLPPITVFYEGIIKHPFRLHYSEEHNLLISICEVPFLQGSYSDLARTLMSWALNAGIKDVICLQGLADNSAMFLQGPYPVFVAGEKEIVERFKKAEDRLEKPPKGLIMGPEAAILNECLNNKLNGAVLLTVANPQIPCPEGAAAILKVLAKLLKFEIKIESLLEQAQEIKSKLLELTDKTNKMHSQGLSEPSGSSRDRFIYS